MKHCILFIFVVFCISAYTQTPDLPPPPPPGGTPLEPNHMDLPPPPPGGIPLEPGQIDLPEGIDPETGEPEFEYEEIPEYTDYKIISIANDTVIVDTLLNIKKDYKHNFLRRDNFELFQFHNQGQTFTTLSYDFSKESLIPDMGYRGKHFGYYGLNDVYYYRVPTPTSEIMARTAMEQGQVVDALFTINLSPNLNLSTCYKGLRSLGRYRRSLSSTRALRSSLSYHTDSEKYHIRFHYTDQDFTNEESGGLKPQSIAYFMEDNPEFFRRDRLDTVLERAESLLDGQRYYLDHNLTLYSIKDTLDNTLFKLNIGHEFIKEKKAFIFKEESSSNKVFGNSAYSSIKDSVSYKKKQNKLYLHLKSKYLLGDIKFNVAKTSVFSGVDSLYNPKRLVSRLGIISDAVGVGANSNSSIGKFNLKTHTNVIPGKGELSGNFFKGILEYKNDSIFSLKARLSQVSKKPNFNFSQMQSVYDDYNWSLNFKRGSTQNLGADFISKWGDANIDFTSISNYTYFDSKSRPRQYDKRVTYLKLKGQKEFQYGKFSLMNTLLFQRVTTGSEVLRVPNLITRNTLYYTDYWFKGKPLLVNLGATIRYFTKYKMNAYNPLLAEFRLQNKESIGGFPMIDIFINGRIQRTRLFLKADNVFYKLLKKNYFTAPGYPNRDYVLRFGLVWNWFI